MRYIPQVVTLKSVGIQRVRSVTVEGMQVHRSHPQVYDMEVVQNAVVFDCAQCKKTFFIRAAYVQADGTLRCMKCTRERTRWLYSYRWCPHCRQAKPFKEFERDYVNAGRHQWCLQCVAALKERESLTRACDSCGNEFTPSRRDARFCCSRCRVRAYRAARS
jgi:hypothetical protein